MSSRDGGEPVPTEPRDPDVPTVFGAIAATPRRQGIQILFNMVDYVQQSVDHYKRLAGVDKLKPAKAPYCPDGSLLPANDEVQGELSDNACSILMEKL